MKTDDRIEKCCRYCERAKSLADESVMLCGRYGVVDTLFCCRRFRYDPLKRNPKRAKLEDKLDELEFIKI